MTSVHCGARSSAAAPTPDSIAERFVELAGRSDEREQLGRSGRRRYEHLDTQDAFGEPIIAVFQSVLEQAGVQTSTALGG